MFWHQEHDFFKMTVITHSRLFQYRTQQNYLEVHEFLQKNTNYVLHFFGFAHTHRIISFLSCLTLVKLAIPILAIILWNGKRLRSEIIQWSKLLMAVGAIGGSSYGDYWPVHGQRQYHCSHNQYVVNCTGRMRHIKPRF